MKKYLLILIALLCFTSCGNKKEDVAPQPVEETLIGEWRASSARIQRSVNQRPAEAEHLQWDKQTQSSAPTIRFSAQGTFTARNFAQYSGLPEIEQGKYEHSAGELHLFADEQERVFKMHLSGNKMTLEIQFSQTVDQQLYSWDINVELLRES